MTFLLLLPLAASVLLAAVAALALAGKFQQAQNFGLIAESIALLAFLLSCLAAFVMVVYGPGTSALLGAGGVGLSTRLDAVSAVMFCLVTFIGWITLRYSRSYLVGEQRSDYFVGWMAATLASVVMLVSSGNLVQLVVFWIATSLCLHKLLLFYPNRLSAVRAARKKFMVARLADAALVVAAVLLATSFNTTDIATLLSLAKAGSATSLAFYATALLAVAAVLKSAQFPTHGWLTEVMETPTPVSALLHAGVINAGGFLLIRFADVMLLVPGVLAILVIVGGFTAIFAGAVMLAQSAIKTSLAWSTVSQMGFMMMQCGLALFPLALLHIVAHSLYKAYAFLNSGTAVVAVNNNRRPGPVATPTIRAVIRSFVVALMIYAAIGFGIGFDDKSPQAIALGAILIFGVAYLIAQGFAEDAPKGLTVRVCLYAVAASISYFLIQRLAELITANVLPSVPAPGPLEWALITVALISFALVALAQAMFPNWSHHPAMAGLRVHLANGFYINALSDRLVGSWTVIDQTNAAATVRHNTRNKHKELSP